MVQSYKEHLSRCAAIGLFALAYFGSAQLGLHFSFADTNATPLWPPSGLSIAVLLLFSIRLWPGVAIGAFAANALTFWSNGIEIGSTSVLTASVIAAGNTAEAVAGVLLIRRIFKVDLSLSSPADIYKFSLVAAMASTISAAIGTTALYFSSLVTPPSWAAVLGTWWVGDFSAMMVIIPLFLAWRDIGVIRMAKWEVVHLGLYLAALSTLLWLIFGNQTTSSITNNLIGFLLLPCLGWAAYRYGHRGVTLGLALVAGYSVYSTVQGRGPFSFGGQDNALFALELFIGLCCLIGLVLAADVAGRRKEQTKQFRVRAFIHWVTLFVCIALTIGAWQFVASSTEARAEERFNTEVTRIKNRIIARMGAFEQILKAGQGLFHASSDVDASEWASFMERLEIEKSYPGMLGVGFARLIEAEQLAQVEQERRGPDSAAFAVWPRGPRARYTPVYFLYPENSTNARALGYDMYSEATRRHAIDEATRTGRTALTGAVVLVQDQTRTPGFLIYIPVQKSMRDFGAASESRTQLYGFVYSPFRMSDLMRGLLPANRSVAIEIFDEDRTAGATKLYSDSDASEKMAQTKLSKSEKFRVIDRAWTLRATSTAAFESEVDRDKPLIVLVAGSLISLLFFSVVRALADTKEVALELAGQMSRALEESEIRFGSLVESATDFSIIATDPDGLIQVFSGGAERLLGYAAIDMIGTCTPAAFHVPAEVEARATELTLEFGRAISGFDVFVEWPRRGVAETREWSYRCSDGGIKPVQLTVSAVQADDGAIMGFLGIARDITEQKLAAQSLLHARDRAEQASQAKTAFVANISHEVRTPLNAILGIVHMLKATTLQSNQRRYLGIIDASGQTLLGILNDVLDFSKVEAGKLSLCPLPFQLNDLLQAVGTMMSVHASERDLDLVIDIDPEVPWQLMGDALRVQQILVNLTSNAVKFTKRGQVVLLIRRDGKSIVFKVRDTGIGISESQQKILFQPFTQADSSVTRQFGGTGLGLTITRHLVALMGGSIDMSSIAGKGSEFVATIPLVLDQNRSAAAWPSTGHHRLLVIDSSASSRTALQRLGVGLGWTVVDVDSLELGNSEGAFDAILIDWHFATASAIAVLRRQHPAARLVLMASLFGQHHLLEVDAPILADWVLTKPITPMGLIEALDGGAALGDADAPVSNALREEPLTNTRFLLVEDNHLNQEIAMAILRNAGASVRAVSNGKMAVSLLRTDAEHFDAVLMDVQMPVMDGFTATRLIRKELGLTLPIIAMSAGVLQAEVQSCLDVGMDGFISKPIVVEQMFEVIDKLLGRTRQDPTQRSGAHRAGVDFNIEQYLELTTGNDAARLDLIAQIKTLTRVAPGRLLELKAAWDDGLTDEVAHKAHTLRGWIGSFGAQRFSQTSLALEDALRCGDFHRAKEDISDLEENLRATMRDAQAWLDGCLAPTLPQSNAASAGDLRQFSSLLAGQNLDAQASYRVCASYLDSQLSHNDAVSLELAMASLDFPAALSFVQSVMDRNETLVHTFKAATGEQI